MRCSGHAAFDNEDGEDIVCAGVSALLGALAGGLQKVVGIDISLEEGDGLMALRIPARLSPEQMAGAQVLMQSTVLALEELAKCYVGFLQIRWLAPWK